MPKILIIYAAKFLYNGQTAGRFGRREPSAGGSGWVGVRGGHEGRGSPPWIGTPGPALTLWIVILDVEK